MTWVLGILVLLAVAAGIYLYLQAHYLKKEKTLIQKNFELLEQKVDSLELERIKYKLNPHLFKNTLNSIQSHAYQTYYSLDKLANVLDYILYESDRQFVSLREEMEFTLSLIEINRLKLSPLFDLRIKNQIPENDPLYEQKCIVPLISVDLIENAFKHADLQSADSFISIVFELRDEQFLLTVSNKISQRPAMKKSNSGFGNANFVKRLNILYRNNYTFDQFTENNVYISHLKINLREQKTEMPVAG
ncbi:MAG: sensor histidine kinase [Flavobacteriales bacterium]